MEGRRQLSPRSDALQLTHLEISFSSKEEMKTTLLYFTLTFCTENVPRSHRANSSDKQWKKTFPLKKKKYLYHNHIAMLCCFIQLPFSQLYPSLGKASEQQPALCQILVERKMCFYTQ